MLNQTTSRMPLRSSEKLITSIVQENEKSTSTLPEPLPEQFIKINHLSAILRDKGFELPFASTQSNDAFVLTEVSRIIHELKDSGIYCVVIKSLPAVAKPIGDVDILVDDLVRELIRFKPLICARGPNHHFGPLAEALFPSE